MRPVRCTTRLLSMLPVQDLRTRGHTCGELLPGGDEPSISARGPVMALLREVRSMPLLGMLFALDC